MTETLQEGEVRSDFIRDHVLPVVLCKKTEGGVEFSGFLGSAFTVSSKGFALTASHILPKDISKELMLCAMVAQNNDWIGLPIAQFEKNASEDICLLRIEGKLPKPIFSLSEAKVHSGFQYHLFGYPLDTLHEVRENRRPDGRIAPRPDLIYNKGYVRRRISFDIGVPNVIGKQFLELSELAGRGCSGGPVHKLVPGKSLQVVGIYVGERFGEDGIGVAYPARIEAIIGWKPKMLDANLFEFVNEGNGV
jgi:hypothetical protein